MKKPIIGITSFIDRSRQSVPYFSLKESYVKAIEMAGGIPVILSATSPDVVNALIPTLDGLVFSGGGDIAPWLFGQEPLVGLGSFDTVRDEWEIELCNRAWEARIPMLGICRGCQLMNVARGGSLLQDIERSNPEALLHNPQIAHDELHHHIIIERDSILFELFETESLLVNSFHHQAVDKVASDFKITARGTDGIIEALEPIDSGRFALALQFHPEGLFLRYGAFLKPFSALIAASCKGDLTGESSLSHS
ncbi:MAG TPA: gamma-glutamyl-gamma-aminobutyrate hydrolase family protein [Rectinema sp.]|nr:gamma-glutamyl-gamma-aminobutyrate hydrolase family protein [Rectinema sp.]